MIELTALQSRALDTAIENFRVHPDQPELTPEEKAIAEAVDERLPDASNLRRFGVAWYALGLLAARAAVIEEVATFVDHRSGDNATYFANLIRRQMLGRDV